MAYCKANNATTTQQNFARSDEASLASAGFPMFTTFIKDVTPEIFNPRGLRMVSVNLYAANFSVFNQKHIVHDFHGVQTCMLKLLLLLIDPSGFFHQANATINEVINFNSVERSVYMKERLTVSCLKANMDHPWPSSGSQFSQLCFDQ